MNKLMSAASSLIMMLAVSSYLAGCGGGTSVAGIDGSGSTVATTTTTGTVNGFGSVIVNGVRYHSDKAKILVNGQVASETSLHTGYQVRVTGTLNADGTGDADTIEFTSDLIGHISAIDSVNEQLTLLGQTVQITNSTIFDIAISPNDLSGLSVGTNILISGQFNSEGIIAATRIELATESLHQILGTISNLNTTESTFSLNNLTVDYSAATLNNFTDNQLRNGLRVSVLGNNVNGIFNATTINFQKITFATDVKNAEVEGYITRFVSTADFDVAGIKCSTAASTTYENGDSTNLALGASLEVNGKLNTAGVLIAQKIEYRTTAINQISGQVTSVTAPIAGAIATGTLQIGSTTVISSNLSRYEDRGNERLRRFNFADIHVGDFLKISGYTTEAGFVATKIERKPFESNAELEYEGLVTQVDANSFMVYGKSILVDEQTEIRGDMGVTLTQEEFLSQALSKQVRVHGIVKTDGFTATSIEIRSLRHDDFDHHGGSERPH